MRRAFLAALAALSIILFTISASSWDTYVFIESTIALCKGVDPYSLSHWVGAYIPGLGPMWIAYPPLSLFFWAPLVCGLSAAKVPLSVSYLWAIKLPPTLALVVSAYISEKLKKGSWKYVLFNPIALATIYAHGMFDSITALFLLLSVYYYYKDKSFLSGTGFGLAVASKQHALLALPAFLIAWKRKGNLSTFMLMSLFSFVTVIAIYGVLVGPIRAFKDVMGVFLFHTDRPPNALGFGGFATISLYGDAFGGYAGNLADATLLHGTAVTLHSLVITASIPAIFMILLSSILFDLPLAIFLSYTVYILLFYVGALQHMIVPATFLYLAIEDRKLRNLFMFSYIAYALSHMLSFWDIFPILVSPLFLKPFGLWLAKCARIMDVTVPYWDLYLKASGIVLTGAGLVFLLLASSKLMNKNRRGLGYVLVGLYILELLILIFLIKGYAAPKPITYAYGEKFCGVYPWENLEFPGRRFGDFMSHYAVPPKDGYFSLVLPIAEELAKGARRNGVSIAVIARIDLLRSYEVSDLLSALIKNRVRWVWAVVVSDKESDYIDGLSSAPPNDYVRLAQIIRANIPIKGYFKLGGILGLLNQTLMHIPPPTYPYPTLHGKPVVLLIPLNASTQIMNMVREVFNKYGLNTKVVNITIANVVFSEDRCGLPFLHVRSYPQPQSGAGLH